MLSTFEHSRGELYELTFENVNDTIRVTLAHPIWSEDRQSWVRAAELEPGERVRCIDGVAVVRALLPSDTEPVYNIEVDGDHCYRVGERGVLVHNASTDCCIKVVNLVTTASSLSAGITTSFPSAVGCPIAGGPAQNRPWNLNNPGPYSAISADLVGKRVGDFAYVVWVVFEGSNLDKCKFERWVRASLVTSDPMIILNKKRGFQAGGRAARTLDTLDLTSATFVDRTNTRIVLADGPGFTGLPESALPANLGANFFAVAISKEDNSFVAQIWYDYILQINSYDPGGMVNEMRVVEVRID